MRDIPAKILILIGSAMIMTAAIGTVMIVASCTTDQQQCTYCWNAMPHH